MKRTRRAFLGLGPGLAAAVLAGGSGAAEPPVLRAAVLEFGTVRWELEAIKALGLDRANGFELQVQGYAGEQASRVAFLGGEADTAVADWLWGARQRAAGAPIVFLPYSRAVGGVLVAPDSKVEDLSDLRGKTVGIAGGPLDKSWLILQAYAADRGFDLKGETRQVFGAPPLLSEQARAGEIDALVTFWHFMARLEADGFRRLIGVDEAARALGLDPETPLLGYLFKESFVAEHPDLVGSFTEASRAAKRAMREDAIWERLRPLVKAEDEAEFAALKAGFRAGIPASGAVDRAAAEAMFSLMARLGGRELTGEATELPDGVFLGR